MSLTSRGRAISAASRVALVTGLTAALVPVAAASAAPQAIAVDRAVDRECAARDLGGRAGTATQRITARATGELSARLSGGRGDWDVAVFDARSGATVAAAAGFGSREVAQGLVSAGQRLDVQVCRRDGASESVSLDVATAPLPAPAASYAPRLVRVAAPTRERRQRLADLGLDLTEHGDRGGLDVVLHSEADELTLRKNRFDFAVVEDDLAAQDRAYRRADRRYSRAVESSDLPSGRTTYRRLFDYESELRRLADERPDLVRPITLPHRTWEGRAVQGIEITSNPTALDGKPVFLQMGVHHAREWPSSEHAMEWAYELVRGYDGDARVRRLVDTTRTIVIPVVNPDGFNLSREAGERNGAGGGRANDDDPVFLTAEYKRKNCRNGEAAEVLCTEASRLLGTDPNRNYGGFWGGPGAGVTPTSDTYRGPAPFSEPETRNIRDLVSRRQVTTLISNHTYSNLVLRPPGLRVLGAPVDEDRGYRALGDAMAAENGYASQPSYALYDTSGTTEDWSYYATGGFGFTFEIGPTSFHPPFADVVAEYEGTASTDVETGVRGGNREAYFIAQESTADERRHSVLVGGAPPGRILRLRKAFETETAPVLDAQGNEGPRLTFPDTLDTTLQVPESGRFEWHVNPSTRPIVAQPRGREAAGSPSPSTAFAEDPPEETSCGDAAFPEPGGPAPPTTCYEDEPFEIAGAPNDNARTTVRIDWGSSANDYDMVVYRREADGSLTEVGSSAQGQTAHEQVILADPQPGSYLARVIFYAVAPEDSYRGTVSFAGPEPFRPARTETWRLTCETDDGRVLEARDVLIERGERQRLDLACRQGEGNPAGGPPRWEDGTGHAPNAPNDKGEGAQ